MKSENENNKLGKKSGKPKKPFQYWLNGGFLTEDFVGKQSKLLLLIFVLIIIFISNRYYCSKKLTEMDNLKKELVVLKNVQVDLNSRLTKMSRQTQIEELLKEKGIALTKSNTTVYKIRK